MQTVPQFFKKARTRDNKSYDCVTFAARKINIGKFQHKKTNVMVVTDVAVSKNYFKKLYIVSLVSKGKKVISLYVLQNGCYILRELSTRHEKGEREGRVSRETRERGAQGRVSRETPASCSPRDSLGSPDRT